MDGHRRHQPVQWTGPAAREARGVKRQRGPDTSGPQQPVVLLESMLRCCRLPAVRLVRLNVFITGMLQHMICNEGWCLAQGPDDLSEEEQIKNLALVIRRSLNDNPAEVGLVLCWQIVKMRKQATQLLVRQAQNLLLDCATELSERTPVFAVIVGKHLQLCCENIDVLKLSNQKSAGLLNAEDSVFVKGLLAVAQARLNAALAAGDRFATRTLLRFMGALALTNVVHASSVLAALASIVEAATHIAEAGAQQCLSRSMRPTYRGAVVTNPQRRNFN